MSKNKILHVVDSFYPAIEFGGPILSTKALCDFIINDSNLQLTVLTNNKLRPHSKLTLDEKSENFISTTKKYNVNWIDHSKWYSEFSFIIKLIGLIRKSDIIHLTGMFNKCSFYTIISAFLFNKKIIISPRGSIQAIFEFSRIKKLKFKLLVLKFYSFILRYKKSYWLGTTEVENSYSNRIKRLKSFTCINPVDIPLNNFNKTKTANKSIICFISRLSQKKGLIRFLNITSKLSPDNFEIIIAGSPENEIIHQKVLRYTEKYNHIKYYGLVAGSNKKKFYTKSDLFFFPSDSENFGIVIAEALSYGCSVLTSVKSPWNKHCEKGVLEIFELSDSDDILLKKIINISNLKKAKNNLKFNCVQIIKKHYSYNSMSDQIYNAYKTIINNE